jgi:hypothetical protein
MADDDSNISDEQHMSDISSRNQQVTTLLAKKDKIGALRISLQNPPLASKSNEVKVIAGF